MAHNITYMWYLNMAQMNLSTKQKQTCRHREQTFGCQRGRDPSNASCVSGQIPTLCRLQSGIYVSSTVLLASQTAYHAVTEQDSRGPSWDKPSPIFSALAPLWKSESISRSVLSDSSWPHGRSPPGSSGNGILQARILEWGAIPFSKGYSWPRDQIQVSCTAGRFFTIWTIGDAPFSEVPGYQCLIHISRVILQMWKPHTKWKMLTPWWPWVPSIRSPWA